MPLDRVLFVGEAAHPDFRGPWEYLRSQCRELRAVLSPEEAGDALRRLAAPPELTVVAQSWPGQFRQTHIETLHRAAPLSRLIALLGSWCEGETCSGAPWSGVPRLYWHEFVARLRGGAIGSPPWDRVWRLPRTATDAERVDAACRPRAPREGRVAIAAGDWLTYEGLAEGCAQAGYAATWLRPEHGGPVRESLAGVWDDACGGSGRAFLLEDFAARVRPAPVAALLSFPRQGDWRRARDAGAALVYAKPFSWEDLLSDLAGVEQAGGKTGQLDALAYANNIPA